MSQTIYCKRHTDIETSVTCGRCGDPICPRCLIHAPVGVRCPDCGSSRPAPTFDVSPVFLLRGVAAGVGVAVVGAAVLAFVIIWMPLVYISALLVAGFGIVVGEVVSLATNRKRGVKLKIVAGSSVALAFLLINLYFVLTGLPPDVGLNLFNLIGAGAGVYLATTRF